MNNREMISAIEDIIDTERELREQIDRLNVQIRCNAILSSMGSDELKRQEQIVNNIDIGEFDGSFDSKILTPEELESKKKERESLDFSINTSFSSSELDSEEVERRSALRKSSEISMGDTFETKLLSKEEQDRRNEERKNKSIDLIKTFESKSLSPEELENREQAREDLRKTFKIDDDEGQVIEIKNKKVFPKLGKHGKENTIKDIV